MNVYQIYKLNLILSRLFFITCSFSQNVLTLEEIRRLIGFAATENIKNQQIGHSVRQAHMTERCIGQIVIGNFIGWTNLKTGHPSGLDCIKNDGSIIIELKNKYNTCNSSSGLTLLDKLAKYKIPHPATRCIWGIINPKPSCKNLTTKMIFILGMYEVVE